jgi:hypothetical protein
VEEDFEYSEDDAEINAEPETGKMTPVNISELSVVDSHRQVRGKSWRISALNAAERYRNKP